MKRKEDEKMKEKKRVRLLNKGHMGNLRLFIKSQINLYGERDQINLFVKNQIKKSCEIFSKNCQISLTNMLKITKVRNTLYILHFLPHILVNKHYLSNNFF